MKVLLQDVAKKEFYAEPGWVARADGAHDFKKSSLAVAFASARGLREIEIVLWFDDPRYNIRLPLESSNVRH